MIVKEINKFWIKGGDFYDLWNGRLGLKIAKGKKRLFDYFFKINGNFRIYQTCGDLISFFVVTERKAEQNKTVYDIRLLLVDKKSRIVDIADY